MRKLILLLIFSFSIGALMSQEVINYPTINAKTYDQYLKKQWPELIETGKLSLKNDVDFYYLQVRMGIAYYELKKYAQAIKHFEKAHSEKKRDDLINEYLYYSYIFSGNYDDARTLIPFFSEELIKKLNIKPPPFINALYFDTKHDINEDYVIVPDAFQTVEQTAVLNQSYYNISMEHLFGKRAKVYHGFTHLLIDNKVQKLATLDVPGTFDEDINQNEYYFRLDLLIAKQMYLKTSVHFLATNYIAVDPVSSWGRRGTRTFFYYYTEKSVVGSMSLSKNFPFFKPTLAFSISNLNQYIQMQPQVSLSIDPFANNILRINSSFTYHTQNENGYLVQNKVIKESISVSFLKHFFFEPSVTFGKLYNFTELDGLIANNDLDPILRRYNALLNISLAKTKFNIFFLYTYNLKENEYKINGIPYTINYINQSITGGIKWYF